MDIIYNLDFDIAGIIILSILCFIFGALYTTEKKSNQLFLGFIITALLVGILDIASACTISYASVVPDFVNYILNTLYLLSAIIFPFLGQEYIKECIGWKSKIQSMFNFILLVLYIVMLIVNFFTGILFSFVDGEYIHGPLFLCNYVAPLLFLLQVLLIMVIKNKSFTRKQLYLNSSVLIFPLLFSILQMMYPTYLLTFFSFAISIFVMLFSLETPDFTELEYLRNNLEEEISKQTQEALEKQHRIELMSIETTKALAQAIDGKDEYSSGHSLRVSAYSVLLAQALDWDPEKVEQLRLAALLHDVGKIGIPDEILQKPEKLSEYEYEIVKTHTTNVGKILHNLTTLPNAEVVAIEMSVPHTNGRIA